VSAMQLFCLREKGATIKFLPKPKKGQMKIIFQKNLKKIREAFKEVVKLKLKT
jgi:hypothetical protein